MNPFWGRKKFGIFGIVVVVKWKMKRFLFYIMNQRVIGRSEEDG